MILIFLVCLLICVVLHEAAHLIVAKLCKCCVEVFSIGFGKPVLWKKKIGETIYQVTPWLFGGYCQLKGELKQTRAKKAFINLPYRKKIAIVAAGCAINILSGILSLVLGIYFSNFKLYYFGVLAITLGITNWFIPIPCLDGGYALWYPVLLKIFGVNKGTRIFAIANRISFLLIMALNIICLPYLIILIKTRGF